jgi:hypothetical protein
MNLKITALRAVEHFAESSFKSHERRFPIDFGFWRKPRKVLHGHPIVEPKSRVKLGAPPLSPQSLAKPQE